MSNVEFENDFNVNNSPVSGQNFYNPGQPRGMVAWLISKGIIQDESQAKALLLGVVVFNIIASILIIYFFL